MRGERQGNKEVNKRDDTQMFVLGTKDKLVRLSRAKEHERERESFSDRRKVSQRNIIRCGSFVWQRRPSVVGAFVKYTEDDDDEEH